MNNRLLKAPEFFFKKSITAAFFYFFFGILFRFNRRHLLHTKYVYRMTSWYHVSFKSYSVKKENSYCNQNLFLFAKLIEIYLPPTQKKSWVYFVKTSRNNKILKVNVILIRFGILNLYFLFTKIKRTGMNIHASFYICTINPDNSFCSEEGCV